MDRLRLGILQTNRDPTSIGTRFPDDAHRFRDLFDAQERRFSYRVYMTVGGEVPRSADEQDAFLITGSPLSVLDDHAWLPPLLQFIRDCDAARTPLFGACFGHQAIAKALGGKVETKDWQIGVAETRFVARKPWMGEEGCLPLYVANHDQVTAMPPGFDLLGEMDGCPIAAMSKGAHVLGLQAHPELTATFLHAVIDAMVGDLSAKQIASARQSMEEEAKGPAFAQWVTRFFEGAR